MPCTVDWKRPLLMDSMNGEVRIWDARRPDAPLYEEVVQPHGLMALAVHSGAPVMARSAYPGHRLHTADEQHVRTCRSFHPPKTHSARLLAQQQAADSLNDWHSVDAEREHPSPTARVHAKCIELGLPPGESTRVTRRVHH